MTNNFFKNNYTAVLGSEFRPGPVLGSRSNTGPGPGSAKSGQTRPGPDHGQSRHLTPLHLDQKLQAQS